MVAVVLSISFITVTALERDRERETNRQTTGTYMLMFIRPPAICTNSQYAHHQHHHLLNQRVQHQLLGNIYIKCSSQTTTILTTTNTNTADKNIYVSIFFNVLTSLAILSYFYELNGYII